MRERVTATLALLGLGASLCVAATPVKRARAHHPARAGAHASPPIAAGHLAGFADSGEFVHALNGRAVGRIAFRWDSSGRIESQVVAGRAGLAGIRMRIECDAHGEWHTVALGAFRDSASVTRAGQQLAVRAEGRIDSLTIAPGTLLHGPPVLLDQVPRAYDRSRGGVQHFPVLYVPVHPMRATVALLGTATRTIAGVPQRFERWRYEIPQAHDVLWTDARGRVCLVADTTEHLSYVRMGYEALRDSTPGLAVRGQQPFPLPAQMNLDSLRRR